MQVRTHRLAVFYVGIVRLEKALWYYVTVS